MSRATSAIVLVSGGLDSVVALALAAKMFTIRRVLFFDYAQRALESERTSAVSVASFYGFEFCEVDVRWLGGLAPRDMRAGATGDRLTLLADVWIPNRNGVFINVAAAFAEATGANVIVCGFNREEAEEFPDNSAEFMERSNRALALSTRTGVRLECPTAAMDKKEMIEAGMAVGAPLSTIWSCYRSGPRMCGACASCVRLRGAIAAVAADVRPVLEFEN